MKFDDDEELEHILAQAMPRGAPWDLRQLVLGAVAGELTAGRGRSLTSWLMYGVAAMVFLAVGLNVAVSMNENRRMARLRRHDSQRPGVAELTKTVATLTDDNSAELFRGYLTSMLPRRRATVSAWPQRELQVVDIVFSAQ